MSVLGEGSMLDLDEALLAASLGEVAVADRAIARAFAEGANPVQVLRAALRHVQRLQLAALAVADGASAADAVGQLRPPVFWKAKPAMERALRVIETWEQRLAASESPELLPVADNLAALRIQLLAGDADPAAVGQLLLTLGEQVGAVAESDVGAPVADRLSQLSDLLRNQGNALANR